MNIRRLFVLGCFLSLSLALALAQGTTSRISGVATDPTGAGVANAKITITNDDTGVSYVIKTSTSGTFAFDSLQIGRYTLRAEAPGFKKFISTGNVLAIGVPTSINPKFQVGGATETVQVQGGYDLIETESSGNFGAIIDNVSLVQLPVVGTRGRNVLSFTQFVPGVVQNGGNAPGGDIVVNGSRDRAWNYTLDGIDDNESSSGGSGTSPSHQNPDMLSEFRVITSNFTAEYGRNTGGQVVMVTKSGTNKFHGNLFEFYQSPFLRADSAAAKAAHLPPTQFVQNIPGGSIGGPIWKDKAFFFYNLELLHALTGTVVTRYVYTPLAKQGKFRYVTSGRNTSYGATGASVDASGNVLATVPYSTYDMVANDPFGVGLDPSVKAYLALAPAPNTYAVGDGLNVGGYTFTGPSTDKQVDQTYKFDYVFNEKNALFGRLSTGHQNTYADVTNSGLQTFPGDPAVVNTFRQPRNMAINYRFSPTTNTTNELVVGFNRFGYAFVNPAYSQAISTPFNFNTIDSVTITSPTNSYLSNNRYLTTLQAVDNFTWVKGTHIIKAGVNLRFGREIDHRGSIGSLNAIPQVSFATSDNPLDYTHYNVPSTGINTTYDQPDLASAANDLLGRIGRVAAGYVSNPTLTAFRPADSINIMDTRWPEYDFYLQDTWHALSNLVIDYGIRDDTRMAPQFKGFPALVPNQDLRRGTPLTSTLQFVPGRYMKDRWDNFGPSIGFSFDPFKNGKTSVRGNFRIAFDRINSFSFSSSVFQGMPGLTYQVTNATVGQDSFTTPTQGVRAANWTAPTPLATPLQLTTPPAYSANALTVSDPDMQTPTVTQWGFSIQQQLLHNTGLTVSYVGNHGTHLYGGYDSNQTQYTSNGFLAAFQQVQAGVDSPLMTQIISGDTRRKSGETGTQFVQRLYASNLSTNNVVGLANSFATRLQNATTANPYGVPLVVSSGLSPTFFKPYQQYLGGLDVLQTHDFSNYNGLQVQVEHRFSQGFSITANYTYSKTLDIRSFDPTFTLVATGSSQSAAGTPFDFNHPRLNYAASDLDSAQVVNGYFVYDLPFEHYVKLGAKWNRIADEVIGGWRLAGDGVYQTGRPITLYSGSYTFSGSVQTPANCLGCNAHMGKVQVDPTSGQTYYLSAAQRAMFSIPGSGQFSNTGRNWFRQNSVWNTDATLSKSFTIYREQYLQVRVEAQNLMNNVTYDTFGSQSIQSSVFTRLNEATDGVLNNSPRRMQLSAKYVF
jgi:hypothetical protein